MQVEQLLNAGLAYYTNFGSWPAGLNDLQGSFLPSGTIQNAWGQNFTVSANTTNTTAPGSQFSVCTTIVGKQAFTAATIIAGRLPMALAIDGTVNCPTSITTACTKNSTTCTIVSSVNIPGQNLNNARSINFAGLYHSGACVAAPSCPLNMVPTIFLTPVSLSGMNDDASSNVYPISSFSTYARGTTPPSSSPPSASSPPPPGASPYNCDGTATQSCGLPATAKYWRACVRIVTQKGVVTSRGNLVSFGVSVWWGGNRTWARDAALILALTRCMPANESTIPAVSGSGFDVFEN
jgi:hypothetical protein